MLQSRSLVEHASGKPASAAIPSAAGRSAPVAFRAVWQFGWRAFDLVFALTTLFLLAPMMCLVALLVSLDGGPILARRPVKGRDGRIFGCIKYRTVIDDAESSFSEYLIYNPAVGSDLAAGGTLRFDPRITAIGRLLRSSGLDELPQLLNVLRGDMSVFGPPAIEAFCPDQRETAARSASDIRPGLTDLKRIDCRPWRDATRLGRDLHARRAPKDFTILARGLDAVRGRRSAL